MSSYRLHDYTTIRLQDYKYMSLIIAKGKIVTPLRVISDGWIKIQDGIIEDVSESPIKYSKDDYFIDASEKTVFPGLINAHDHLVGTWLPKVVNGPYLNWWEWDQDFKRSDVFKEREAYISRDDQYLLGAYKSIFSGVTTVSDHVPHEINLPYIPISPIRIVDKYTLAHSVGSLSLQWGEGIDKEHNKAKKENIPFILHINEGFDPETVNGLKTLDSLGSLSSVSVLIHCISFSDSDMKLVSEKYANVVWCPNSNYSMYQKTANIKRFLELKINTSIGTDSCITGSINLLEEVRFGKELYKKMYGEEIEAKTLVEMMTVNPAKALKLNDLGSIEKGKIADILIIDKNEADPYNALIKTYPYDVSLLLKSGVALYGDVCYKDLFQKDFSVVNIKNRKKAIIGRPLDIIKKIRKSIGYNKDLPFMPIDES